MSKKNFFTKAFAGTLATLMAVTPAVSVPVFAAPGTGQDSTDPTNNKQVSNDLENSDIIDYHQKGSLTIYKYDITSAEAAGDYTEGERIANGEKDAVVEEAMADYAIEGVQFTYLRVGNIETYSNTAGGQSQVNVVYEIPERLAEILTLDTGKFGPAYDMDANGVAEKCTNEGVLHYDSTQLSDALAAILAEDELKATSDLEEYLYSYGTQDNTKVTGEGTDVGEGVNTSEDTGVTAVNMPLTDKNGKTEVKNLNLGLYLLVETKVPEQVTSTTNPWFVSLPFTNMTPDEAGGGTGEAGGNYWLYDMTCYPKNQTGNPTLDKSVRNAYSNTNAVDKNGTINRGDTYAGNKDSNSLVVFNDDSNNPNNSADTDEAAYVANRGGYTSDGTTAGKDGAGYSYDFEYRDTNTASAGDVLDYILVSKLPTITSKGTFLSEYTFTDILSEGLTYNRDVKIAFYDNPTDANANNTKNAVTQWNLSEPEKYDQQYAEVVVTTDDGNSQWKDGSEQLTVKLTELGLQMLNGEGTNGNNIAGQGSNKVSNNSYSDMYMVVYYTVTVNSDASLVLGDEGNENDVVLQWERTSNGYYNTLEDRNYIYAYSLDLTKEFSDKQGDMSKVGFKLYNTTDAYYVNATQSAEDPSVWYVTGKTVNKDDATTFVPTEDGRIVVYGLEADEYAMTEITTDNGYTLLEDSINVVITPTDRDVIASVAGTTGLSGDDLDAIIAAYHGGIYNENGQLVNVSKDEIFGNSATRPAVQSPNGRTIGKTDMYVGEIVPATATVDGISADMKEHTYTEGEGTQQKTSAHATVVLNVVNNKNFTLPQTGGYGTILFTLAGCAAAVGGVLLITKKSKKKEA